MDNSIEIEGLHYAYDRRRPILRDVTIRVPQGRVVAIMGGSGSGKTTLLRNICGQVIPDEGDVRTMKVMGENLVGIERQDLYQLRKKMGVLFQFGGLFTDLSTLDNVAFPLREHTDWSEKTIRDLALLKLEAVGLRGSAQLYPSELSGGMARRVALARSVAMDPRVILYDEPFAGLDPISLSITAQLIRTLNNALSASTIIVTHDVAESFQIVDYVYLMWQGEIVAEGTPDELQNSTEPYVRQFIKAEADGPLPFHQPAPPLKESLELSV